MDRNLPALASPLLTFLTKLEVGMFKNHEKLVYIGWDLLGRGVHKSDVKKDNYRQVISQLLSLKWGGIDEGSRKKKVFTG